MKKYNAIFITLVLIYFFASLIVSLDQQVSETHGSDKARLLSMAVVIPSIIVWSITFFAFTRLKSYSRTIIKDSDGQAFNNISIALLILSVSYPILATISVLLTDYVRYNPDFTDGSELIRLLLNSVVAVLTSLYTFKGAKILMSIIKLSTDLKKDFRFILAGLGISIFVFISHLNPIGITHIVEGSIEYTNMGLIVSIITGVLKGTAWLLGLQSVIYIISYRMKVSGLVYRISLDYIILGIISVVLTNIFIRTIVTYSPELDDRSIAQPTPFVYLTLAAMAIGYILLALGSDRLKRFETI